MTDRDYSISWKAQTRYCQRCFDLPHRREDNGACSQCLKPFEPEAIQPAEPQGFSSAAQWSEW